MLKIGYKVFTHAWLILGLKYTMVFLLLVFYMSFSIIVGLYYPQPPWSTLFLKEIYEKLVCPA